MQEAARFGIEDGVIGSFHDSEGGRLQVTFAGPAGQGDPRLAREALQIVGPVMTVWPSQGVSAGKPDQVADRAPARRVLSAAPNRHTAKVREPSVSLLREFDDGGRVSNCPERRRSTRQWSITA